MQRHLVFILLVLCSLVLSSCGGRVVERNPTPTAQPTEEHSIANIKSATIRIVIEAAVVKAAVGEDLDVGSGSGFIIDQSGIAVTNNHVVSGASTISVWVGNETEPRKAQVLGVSECSDLAVIDIEGEGYPYLNWFEGKIEPPLEVLAVGFPFGDPEITMTDGIVAKAKVTENLIRAAVEAPIEHTATLNPGNSGGPLVTKDGGEVVGVNFFSDPQRNRYFAIGGDEANKVLEKLRQGQNHAAIGINGQLLVGQDQSGQLSVPGIWIYSVQSGSLADKAGLKAGDLLYKLEGRSLTDEKGFVTYCDILRSHNETSTLTIQVLRGEQCLEGQISGRELESCEKPPKPVKPDPEGPTFTGTWQSSRWGVLEMIQTGNQVTGTYEFTENSETFYGQIEGEVDANNVLNCRWSQGRTRGAKDDSGYGQFTLKDNGNRIEGQFGDTENGPWTPGWDFDRINEK